MRLDSGQIEVIDDSMAKILRIKTVQERLQIGFDMWTFAQKFLISHLGSVHPDWDLQKVQGEVSRRLSHGAL